MAKDVAQERDSTDAADVSQVVPPLYADAAAAPEPVKLNKVEYAHAAVSAKKRQAMIQAAKAMAMCAIDGFSLEDLFNQITRCFLKGKGGDNSTEG